jgi:hypothetical protein
LILIGHVQLSVEEPHASAPTPRPIAGDRPLAVTPHSAWGRFATKSKPDRGQNGNLLFVAMRYVIVPAVRMPGSGGYRQGRWRGQGAVALSSRLAPRCGSANHGLAVRATRGRP